MKNVDVNDVESKIVVSEAEKSKIDDGIFTFAEKKVKESGDDIEITSSYKGSAIKYDLEFDDDVKNVKFSPVMKAKDSDASKKFDYSNLTLENPSDEIEKISEIFTNNAYFNNFKSSGTSVDTDKFVKELKHYAAALIVAEAKKCKVSDILDNSSLKNYFTINGDTLEKEFNADVTFKDINVNATVTLSIGCKIDGKTNTFSISSVDFSIKDVDAKEVMHLPLGLLTADLSKINLTLDVGCNYDSNNKVYTYNVSSSFVKAGASIIQYDYNDSQKTINSGSVSLEYDFAEDNWILPGNLANYAAITGYSIVNEFSIVSDLIQGTIAKVATDKLNEMMKDSSGVNFFENTIADALKLNDDFDNMKESLYEATDSLRTPTFKDYKELNKKLNSNVDSLSITPNYDSNGLNYKIKVTKKLKFVDKSINLDLAKAINGVSISSHSAMNFTGDGDLEFTIIISYANGEIKKSDNFSTILNGESIEKTNVVDLFDKMPSYIGVFAEEDTAKFRLNDTLLEINGLSSCDDVKSLKEALENAYSSSSKCSFDYTDNNIVIYSGNDFSIKKGDENYNNEGAFSIFGFSDTDDKSVCKALLFSKTSDIKFKCNDSIEVDILKTNVSGLSPNDFVEKLNEYLSTHDSKSSLNENENYANKFGLYAIYLKDTKQYMIVCDDSRATDKNAQDTFANVNKTGVKSVVVSRTIEKKVKPCELEIKITQSGISKTINIKRDSATSLNTFAFLLNEEIINAGLDIDKVVVDNDCVYICDDKSFCVTVADSSKSVAYNSKERGQFTINNKEIAIDIDSSKSTIENVCDAINAAIKNAQINGISLEFDSNGFFKFKSSSEFTLESILDCELLSVLGFNNYKETSTSDGSEHFIKGNYLGIADTSQCFDFNLGKLEINLEGNVGKIGEFKDITYDIKSQTLTITTENLEKGCSQIGDYLKIDNECFKITSISYNDSTKKTTFIAETLSSNGKDFADFITGGVSDENVYFHVDGFDINANFVDAKMLVDGACKFNVEFDLNNYLNNYQNNGNLLEDLTNCFNITTSGSINLDGLVEVGSYKETFNIGKAGFNGGDFDVSALKIDASSFLKNLDNFSMENVLGMLNNLADKITEAVSGMDTKIPLINIDLKSLVRLGENISQVVSEVQSMGINSIQSLQKIFNERLEKAKLCELDSSGKIVSGKGLSLSVVGDVLYVKFDLRKSLNESYAMDLWETAGVHGAANILVGGDLDFVLDGYFDTSKEFSFVLNDAIKLESTLSLTVEKPTFDLSVPRLNLKDSILHVGSKDGKTTGTSSLNAGFKFLVNFGGKGKDFSSLYKDKDFSYGYDYYVSGDLYVNLKESYLGCVTIRTYDSAGKVVSALSTSSVTVGSKPSTSFQLNDDSSVKSFNGVVIDFSGIKDTLDKFVQNLTEGNLYEKLKLAVSGLDSFLDVVDTSMNDGLAKQIKTIPVAGKALSAGADFVSKIHQNLIEPLANLVYSCPDLDSKTMATYFAGWFKNAKVLPSSSSEAEKQIKSCLGNDCMDSSKDEYWSDNSGALNGIFYKEFKESSKNSKQAAWFFTLGGECDYGKNLDFDLGFPGLGLSAEGGVSLKLCWTLNFGIKISADGFELILPNKNELDVNIEVLLDQNATLIGKLAGLGVKIGGDNTKVDVGGSFGIDLNSNYTEATVTKDAQSVSIGQILSLNPKFNWEARANLKFKIEVGVVSKSGIKPQFPNISGVFDFEWLKNSGDKGGSVKKLSITDIKVSLGFFVQNVLGPFVSKINSVLEPIEPLVDFLTTPFPVLDDLGFVITPIDLAKQYNKNLKLDFIYALKDLIQLSKTLNSLTCGELALPDIKLIEADAYGNLDADDSLSENFLKGSAKLSSVTSKLETYLNNAGDWKKKFGVSSLDDFVTNAENSLKSSSSFVSESLFKTKKGKSEWKFFWDNITDVYNLLLGGDVMLVQYRMPTLDFSFNWDKFFRIWGPLGVRIGVTFGVKIDFTFGYDTFGIRQWIKGGMNDATELFNGFYIDNSGNNHELTFYGGLSAAAELNGGVVAAGVGGGVDLNIYLDPFDPNKDGKIRVAEITEIIKELGPLHLFDIKGEITAELFAYVELLFVTKRFNITDKITLFSFEIKMTMPEKLASYDEDSGNVIANLGDRAENRVSGNTSDPDEKAKYTIDGEKISWTSGTTTKSVNVKKNGQFIINSGDGDDNVTISTDTGKKCNFNIIINAGDGNDTFDLSNLEMASDKFVVFIGGAGNDRIKGAKGKNIIFGDNGTVVYDSNGAVLYCESLYDSGVAGNDYIDLSNSSADGNIVFGGAGNDEIIGGSGSDFLIGDSGRVSATGEVSKTSLNRDGGNDIIYGLNGDDKIYGGAGNDQISGGAGDDTIYGEKGDDRIWGGSDSDTIHGGDGMDYIVGDTIADSDTLQTYFSSNVGKVLTTDFKNAYNDGSKAIKIDSFKNKGSWGAPSISDTGSGDKDFIYGENDQDVIIAGEGDDEVYGGIGNDLIHGGDGNDRLYGNLDNDVIFGGLGNDLIYGESGDDMLYGDDWEKLSTTNVWNKDDEITYGTNLGLAGAISKDTSKTTGGNDQIFSGSGMDFVDGQGGDDEITIEFMGDSTVGYTNVFDSGNTMGDALIINGTKFEDKILIRASKNDLGFVALIPDNNSNNSVKNENIERVNFSKNIDYVQVDAGDGDDSINIDGTVTDMVVNGGAGDDSFQVGQLYNSERIASSTTHITNDDAFETVHTTDGYVSNGVNLGTSLTLNGDEDKDSFNIYHSVGDLNMFGGANDDTFNINGFTYDPSTPKSGTVENGAIGIDGGAGNDIMIMNGTRGDDHFVVNKEGLVSDIAAVDAVGVEKTEVNAGDGDDTYYVLSSTEENAVELNGGFGNDTISVGGLEKGLDFKTTSVEGDDKFITFTLDKEKNSDVNATSVVSDKFTVVQTNERAICLKSSTTKCLITSVDMKEASNQEILVEYAGKQLTADESIEVTISLPRVSKNSLQSGNRGVVVASPSVKSGYDEYKNTYSIVLDSSTPQGKFKVLALKDVLQEGLVTTGLIIKAVLKNSLTGSETVLKQTSLTVNVLPNTSSYGLDKLIAKTDVYDIDNDTTEIDLGNSMTPASVFVENRLGQLEENKDYKISDNKLIFESSFKSELSKGKWKKLYVHYRTDSMDFNGSSFNLAYSEIDGALTVELDSNVIPDDVSSATNYYYKKSGSTITFYSKDTQRQVSVSGILTVTGKAVAPASGKLVDKLNLVDNQDQLIISKSSTKIYESAEASDPSKVGVSSTIAYRVGLKNIPESGKKVIVTFALKDTTGLSVECSDSSFVDNFDGTYSITFDGNKAYSPIDIFIKAFKGCCSGSNTRSIGAEAFVLDGILSDVTANGYGKAGGLNLADTVVLKYNHTYTGKTSKQMVPSELNNVPNGVTYNRETVEKSDDDCTDRIFVNNYDSDADAASTLERSYEQSSDPDENEKLDKVNSLLYTYKQDGADESAKKNIKADNFEYGEYNLGSGIDNVDISKTLYRDDGFQTFTVVNTGEKDVNGDTSSFDEVKDDVINVSSYGSHDGQLVVNAQGGEDTINASSEKVTKNGMIVFGGDGKDYIDVGQGVIAFGDKGNIKYIKPDYSDSDPYKNGVLVTELGYDDSVAHKGDILRASIEKYGSAPVKFDKQTDGIVRGPASMSSVASDEGCNDVIIAGGTGSIVVGGFGEDEISVTGQNNVILGDNGVIKYHTDEKNGAKWNDAEKPAIKLEYVETLDNGIGSTDDIDITGSNNVVMGGAGHDTIDILAESDSSRGDNNIVLGDGGKYSENSSKRTIETIDNNIGNQDDITIRGGNNTVMGGFGNDNITIGVPDEINANNNIVLGDGGSYSLTGLQKIVETKEDGVGGTDTIKIYGGGNTVMGGAKDDEIFIGEKGQVASNNNVVLGDGGKYDKAGDIYTKIETTSDGVGGTDKIKIYGGENTVMGGAMNDRIVIGDVSQATSNDNVVLGDGGCYYEDGSKKTIETHNDDIGGTDAIKIYGGGNTVMGGAKNDKIIIGEKDQVTCDNNVVLGDGGIYDLNKGVSAEIKTTHDTIGGKDRIKIYGGKNVAMGGFENDVIKIVGSDNVVLGDGGIANFVKNDTDKYVVDGLVQVETTSDKDGGADDIDIYGDINVVMGGADDDQIDIHADDARNVTGSDNVVVGDGGKYVIKSDYQTVNTKSEIYGGKDVITTGDGKNVVLGGTEVDFITTGKGNDIIAGDGGFVMMDSNHNALLVTNDGYNTEDVDENGNRVATAGADVIKTTGGDNVIFGGLNEIVRLGEQPDTSFIEDDITSGDGNDVIFGDNGYATFRGNADLVNTNDEKYKEIADKLAFDDAVPVKTKSTLSFNFQGTAQNGLGEQETAGAGEYAASHWNNISGSIAGTFGNDDSEIVRFDDGTRASAVSVSYSGYESHRNTSTDNAINLQAYNLGLNGANYDSNKKLMNSGLMTTAPSDQCDNRLDVSVDGLAQYFTGFDVVVYLDIPDSHSWADQSVRRVGLWIDGIEVDAYYVNDKAGLNYRDENYVEGLKEAKSRAYVFDEDDNITGSVDLTSDSAKKVAYANYVVFHVKSDTPVDRIVVRITDGFTKDNINGKDLPGIAGIQIQGTLHKQDIAASTDITFGDKDIIHSNGGDDIVVGGTGSDEITTYGDDRKGIYDNDVVFGDNAMLLFTDRDSNDNTASTLTTAESITATNKDAEYNDIINTGDGNDVVVGGIGSDTIKAGATNDAEKMLDDVKAWSLNFTNERSDSSNSIKSATYKQIDYGNYVKEADGETAGVVADNDWCNMYLKNGSLHKTVACDGNENQFKGIDVSISAYRENDWNKDNAGNYSITHENYDELDGDTANSKLFNFYLAAQQQEEMRITLRGIHNQVGDAKYDLYVYLGGDNADTDTYNYLYQISLNNSEFRYLNDWTGNTFDGDYKEATCDNDYIARCLLHDYATPRIELVGNYVVFRNLTGDVADIRIKNIYSFGGQSPKNLPVVSAIQIVSGAAKDSAAIGGDHDKDLVFGDDAKLTFDLDIPYSSEENLPDYKNRVIEAKSKDVGSLVNSVLTNDIIDTGKDRDVVVGGEDGDKITTGSGDDIAIGGGANLILEHNNPVGVFTPNTEIVLDQHTIDQTIHRNYLDNDNANIYEMQNRIDRNDNSRIRGINTNVLVENDRLDTIDAGEGRNLVSQRNTSTEKLIKEENPVAPTSDYKPSQETGDIEIGSSPVTVHILANQTIKLVCKSGYPVGNQYWTPDVKIRVNNSGNGMIPVLTWEWDEAKGRHVETSNKDYYIVVNIPDHPNTDEGYVIYVTSKEDATISVTVAE